MASRVTDRLIEEAGLFLTRHLPTKAVGLPLEPLDEPPSSSPWWCKTRHEEIALYQTIKTGRKRSPALHPFLDKGNGRRRRSSFDVYLKNMLEPIANLDSLYSWPPLIVKEHVLRTIPGPPTNERRAEPPPPPPIDKVITYRVPLVV